MDLLRRAGLEVVLAGGSGLEVTGKCGVTVSADALLVDVAGDRFDALFLPGGPAVMELRGSPAIIGLIRKFDEESKLIAAICAAPLLLKDAGILGNVNTTAHFSTAGELPELSDARCVYDGRLLTSRGAGTALGFGVALVEILMGGRSTGERLGEHLPVVIRARWIT